MTLACFFFWDCDDNISILCALILPANMISSFDVLIPVPVQGMGQHLDEVQVLLPFGDGIDQIM